MENSLKEWDKSLEKRQNFGRDYIPTDINKINEANSINDHHNNMPKSDDL